MTKMPVQELLLFLKSQAKLAEAKLQPVTTAIDILVRNISALVDNSLQVKLPQAVSS